jgi:hypothetical protein
MQAEIQNLLDGQVALLLSKGYVKPSVAMHMNSNTKGLTFLITYAKFQKNGEPHDWETDYNTVAGDTIPQARDELVKFIANLPLVETLKKQQYNRDLADVIEAGKKLNLNVSSLLAALKESSENLIENHIEPLAPAKKTEDDIPF